MHRILTYNVHRCRGGDGRLSPARIAEVIASAKPDIVTLQEVDVGRRRSDHVDQANEIARELGMQMHFHPAFHVLEERYGDAILTAHPSRIVHAANLPGLQHYPGMEARGALWAAVEIDGRELQVVNAHIGLLAYERKLQVSALLGPDWTGNPACKDPTILIGDFNAVPRSRAYRRMAERFTDAQRAAGIPRPTFPARLPVIRIDHVFVSQSIKVLKTEVIRTPLARVASDHLPLVMDFTFAPGP
ncbi:endonuclease/exonuclease/phosphatase family metal-dependent hydrolase [Stella humosa]|uniref:Endonuclease/exonuclease/phosphatase family metal-dependent hydrolase n=1 Tax=Stella humosa TaxID=94 RepID=A0A3N1MJT9_9PROT|nr:endonuclease/exonuclease/phosphatase family protein [Stella humosa]ROQ01266.1 endonuclease/exonuclease/phosphatase family metal-dependent hydrolase [Stella humosa]BBK31640.1 endonuclease [Stella humosa]